MRGKTMNHAPSILRASIAVVFRIFRWARSASFRLLFFSCLRPTPVRRRKRDTCKAQIPTKAMAKTAGGLKGLIQSTGRAVYAAGVMARDYGTVAARWGYHYGGGLAFALATTSMVVLMPLMFESSREIQVRYPKLFILCYVSGLRLTRAESCITQACSHCGSVWHIIWNFGTDISDCSFIINCFTDVRERENAGERLEKPGVLRSPASRIGIQRIRTAHAVRGSG